MAVRICEGLVIEGRREIKRGEYREEEEVIFSDILNELCTKILILIHY